MYYVDHNTQTTHWTLPTSSSNANSVGTAAVVLPKGWERKVTGTGKTYYVDHNTQSTHWELPSSYNANIRKLNSKN